MEYSGIQWVARQPCSTEDIEMETCLSFIPPHLHSQIFQTFYKGLQVVFRAILETLLAPPAIPLPAVVFRSLTLNDRSAAFYFNKGGSVEYALDCVLHTAKEQSSAYGDGTFEEAWEDDENMGDDYSALPKCANDEDFELARKMLGLDPGIEWGPYELDRDEEMGSDSDNDGEGGEQHAPDMQILLQMLAASRGR
jgi:hypothetical protein